MSGTCDNRGAAARPLVVVGFAEAMSAPESVWSLVDDGFEVAAFGRRGRRSALRHSRHVRVTEVTPPEEDLAAAARDLTKMLDSFGAAGGRPLVLLPLDDAALLLGREVAARDGLHFAQPRGGAIELALDKSVQVELARRAGLRVPETRVVGTAGELRECAGMLPLIMRPAAAVTVAGGRIGKGRNRVCSDAAEFERACAAWDGEGALLVQSYVRGVGEGVFGFACEAGVLGLTAHRRVRMMNPHGSGSSACVAQEVSADVRQAVERLVGEAGWRGLFMVELLRDAAGELWFVEFNGRAWGSMALARRQGFEFPAWAARLALEPGFVPVLGSGGRPGLICRNLGRELVHLAFVLRGPESSALRDWPSPWRTAVELLRWNRAHRFYNWRRDDWPVFFADSANTLRGQFCKPRKRRK